MGVPLVGNRRNQNDRKDQKPVHQRDYAPDLPGVKPRPGMNGPTTQSGALGQFDFSFASDAAAVNASLTD